MEYIYAALLLHSAKKEITEENLKKVLSAAGVEINEAKVKSLVESIKGINIDEVLSSASIQTAPISLQTTTQQPKQEEKKEEKKEEKASDEQAVAGLAALFGV